MTASFRFVLCCVRLALLVAGGSCCGCSTLKCRNLVTELASADLNCAPSRVRVVKVYGNIRGYGSFAMYSAEGCGHRERLVVRPTHDGRLSVRRDAFDGLPSRGGE